MNAPLYIVLGFVLGVGIGFAIAAYRFSLRSVELRSDLSLLRAERESLATDLLQARSAREEVLQRVARTEALLEAKTAEHGRSDSAVIDLNRQLTTARERMNSESIDAETARAALVGKERSLQDALREVANKDAELQILRGECQTAKEQLSEAKANLTHSERANQEIKGFLTEAQTKLSGLFAELAGDAFGKKAEMFEKNVKDAGDKSKSDIGLLLQPFAQRMVEFRQRIESLYGEEARERATLLGAVTELKTLNQDMADKAAALTRALKGNAKIRGDWGELMLETVLSACGLEEGRHYHRQKSKTDDEGLRLRPDIIVRLPDDRQVIVDSKVSLLSWIDATNAETPEAHREALRNHAVSMRQHVKDLSEKNYPKALGSSALEITVAFVPIEGALSAALDADPALQTFAFERRVAFASPNTLMALLGVVERLWTRDKIQRGADEVKQIGGKLMDALVKFLDDFDKIGLKLSGAHDAFTEARLSLSDSNQAVLPRARRLVELGVRGKKLLPEELQPDLIEQAEESQQTVIASATLFEGAAQ